MKSISHHGPTRKTHTPCPLSNTLCDFIRRHHTTPPFAFTFLSHVLSSRRPKPITWQTRAHFPGAHGQHAISARLTGELLSLGLVHLARSYKRPIDAEHPGRCNEYLASTRLLALQAQGTKLYPTWSRYQNRKPLKPQPQPPTPEEWQPDIYDALVNITTNPLLQFDRALAYTLAEPRYNVLASFASIPPGPIMYAVRPATSGRIQTFRPNLQGLPRSLRPAVKPLGEGMLAYIDVRQAEPRVFAALSGDAKLMDDLGAHDFYDLVSARLRLPDRVTAKVLVNAAINGQGAWGLSKALFGSHNMQGINTAGEMLTSFWHTYPKAFTWRAETIDHILGQGFAETRGGNQRHLGAQPEANHQPPTPFQPRRWAATKGISHVVQGTFAEGFNQTITTLLTEGFNVALPVHDAALIHVSTHAAAQDAAALMSETLAKKIGFDFPTAAPRIGTFWTT